MWILDKVTSQYNDPCACNLMHDNDMVVIDVVSLRSSRKDCVDTSRGGRTSHGSEFSPEAGTPILGTI